VIAILCKAVGALLVVASCAAAYWWFYKLAPMRHLADPRWCDAHSEKSRWLEEQEDYTRMGTSPDLCWRGDRIGHYGDKHWLLWLVDRTNHKDFFVCGCTRGALALMSNHGVESWDQWAQANESKTQEEWIRDGFAKYGLTVHLPPSPDDTEPLLRVLGRKTLDEVLEGSPGEDAGESVPSHIHYNAFRWLRDSGFSPRAFIASHATAMDIEPVRTGLLHYMELQSAFPRHNGLGILAFGTTPETARKVLSPPVIVRPWSVALAYAIIIVPLVAGCLLLVLPRRRKVASNT
jgi:hypothetical protein